MRRITFGIVAPCSLLLLASGCANAPRMAAPRSAGAGGSAPIDDTQLAAGARVITHRVVAPAPLHGLIVRPVNGSACTILGAPQCEDGQCATSVAVRGEVCVLYVRALPQVGDPMPPSCHDVSAPSLPRTTVLDEEGHPTWERCEREAFLQREMERMMWWDA